MVYLNGDANLGLTGSNGSPNLPGYLNPIGTTTVQAWADYPYYRKHQEIYSAIVTKTWTWGGQILGPNNGNGAPMVLVAGTDGEITLDSPYTFPLDPDTEADAQGKGFKHVVWVWVSDRDGLQAGMLDAQVDFVLSGANARFFNNPPSVGNPTGDITGINTLSPYSTALVFDGNGFLKNAAHPGVRAAGTTVNSGTSWLRAPVTAEKAMFAKFWPTLNADDFAVTAIDIVTTGDGEVHVDETITSTDYAYGTYSAGQIRRYTDFATGTGATMSYPLDDPILLGDANMDGVVNALDITAVERIILGMDQNVVVQADANYNGTINMGDVIRIEKTFLGLK
jgi:hypothetical protein